MHSEGFETPIPAGNWSQTTRPPKSVFHESYCETYLSHQPYSRALVIHLNAHKICEYYLNVINMNTGILVCIISGKLRRWVLSNDRFHVRTAEFKHVLCVFLYRSTKQQMRLNRSVNLFQPSLYCIPQTNIPKNIGPNFPRVELSSVIGLARRSFQLSII